MLMDLIHQSLFKDNFKENDFDIKLICEEQTVCLFY